MDELSKLFNDKSWRIRFKIAESILDFQDILPDEFLEAELIPTYTGLLKDDEPEVRTIAANKLYEFSKNLSQQYRSDVIINKFIPCIKILVDDMNMNVKSAIASVLLKLGDFLSKDDTIEILFPFFHLLLKDSIPDVRLNVLSNLENVSNVIDTPELSNTLLPTIIELADDVKWRVRLAVIKYIPTLATQFGSDFFDIKLITLCLSWLSDQVFAVREEAGNVLTQLINSFGVEWALKYIIPKLIELSNNSNYLRRMTCLFTINVIF